MMKLFIFSQWGWMLDDPSITRMTFTCLSQMYGGAGVVVPRVVVVVGAVVAAVVVVGAAVVVVGAAVVGCSVNKQGNTTILIKGVSLEILVDSG